MRTSDQAPYFRQHTTTLWQRMDAGARMLVGYIAFFTVALLIFDAMIFLSLLP